MMNTRRAKNFKFVFSYQNNHNKAIIQRNDAIFLLNACNKFLKLCEKEFFIVLAKENVLNDIKSFEDMTT